MFIPGTFGACHIKTQRRPAAGFPVFYGQMSRYNRHHGGLLSLKIPPYERALHFRRPAIRAGIVSELEAFGRTRPLHGLD